jgi:demethylmenaquinone methyltransferase/2-methoxy-6-polyprenyl-1,4-benzoquinol methylase
VNIHDRDPATWRVRDPNAHAQAVRAMFARISSVYDRMNRLLSLGLDGRWRTVAVSRLDAGVETVLDLCAGTGDLARASRAVGRGRVFVAADFTPEMLQRGRKRPQAAGLLWVAADGLCLPLRDGCVDAVVVGFGMRNLADVRAGLREMLRVLRPGGQLVVLEFFRDDPGAAAEARGAPALVRSLVGRLVPLAGWAVGRDRAAYSYLPGSTSRFLTPAEFASLLGECGYNDVRLARLTCGVAHVVSARAEVHSRQKT